MPAIAPDSQTKTLKRPAELDNVSNKHQKLDDKRLPVSLLCGFLGAGKTTLLKHILEQKAKRSEQNAFKCAVIVNDVAELNIDKSLIDDSAFIQSDDVIAMDNGCVCCTLKSDLLTQIIELAKKKTFDYMIIEASGVSEPSQIGKLFADCDEDHDHGAHTGDTLGELARLDTCVTVVDSGAFFSNLEEVVQGPKPDSFPQLLVEQIEYSNVVILNKTDLVDEAQLNKIKEQVSILNSTAQVITARNSSIDVMEVVNTSLYKAADFDKIHQQMTEVENVELKSCCKAKEAKGETPCCLRKRTIDSGKSKVFLAPGKSELARHSSRFGIKSFLYKSRRPFHPQRFVDNYLSKFFVVKADEESGGAEWNGNSEEDQQKDDDVEVNGKTSQDDKENGQQSDAAEKNGQSSQGEKRGEEQQTRDDDAEGIGETHEGGKDVKDQYGEEVDWDWQKEAAEKQALRAKEMGDMFRSKGFVWFANVPDYKVVLNHAGNLMKSGPAGKWNALNKQTWEGTEKQMAELRKDWVEPWGDRRQDLVFIGKDLDHKNIQEILDDCLLTDKEFEMGLDGWKATMGDLEQVW